MPRTRPWVRIADDLRTAITEGHYPPGQPLPTARALMDRWQVARQTVQNAVDQLQAEGLVSSRPGRGWYVAEQRPIRRLARNRLARTERAAGRGAFLTDAETGDWQPEVSVEISREPRRRTAIELVDTGPGGIYARLEELGHRLTRFTESVRGRPPRPEEAAQLGIPYGYPVLAVIRVAFAGDQPVEVNDIVMSADRYELVYSWAAD